MLFFKVFAKLPFGFIYGLSDLISFLLEHIFRYRRAVIDTNLKNAFPDFNQSQINLIRKKFYKNLSDVFLETIMLLEIDENDLKLRIELENESLILGLMAKYNVVILTTSHLCNWEWLGQRVHLAIGLDAVYKPLNNAFFDKLMLDIRSKFGLFPVAIKQILREVIKRKKISRAIGLISDQTPETPESAYWTQFLNQETPFANGADKLARAFNYPVVYIEMTRIGRGKYKASYILLSEPPYDEYFTEEITQRFVDMLAESIGKNPSDWLWSHKRWKHKKSDYGI